MAVDVAELVLHDGGACNGVAGREEIAELLARRVPVDARHKDDALVALAAPDASGGASGEASSKSAARKAALKALEATARAGGRVELLDSFATEVKESDLGSTLRVENDFVDGVMGGDGRDSDPNALSEEAIERAAAGLPIMTDPVDTATMHPSNLVGKYHAWRIKSSYPIPG